MKACFIGSGIGALAGAAFLIRDAGVAGNDITIFETNTRVFGGALDGTQLADGAYSLRGGRMLTTEHYECTWELLAGIPDPDHPGQSVRARTLDFNAANVSHAQARLIDRNRHIIDARYMGFSVQDRLELLRLLEASEEKLADSCITDWLSAPFFETNFWMIWQTTFAFQPWHGATELRRYLHRFINEFPIIDTLAGVKRTEYNQYDSIVVPLERWLLGHSVRFESGTEVTDIAIDSRMTGEGRTHTVTGLMLRHERAEWAIPIAPETLVFFQNGAMTDATSLGTMDMPPPRLTKADSHGWALWEKIAEGRPEFGNPAAFNASIPESLWESFTVTCRNPRFFDAMQALSSNAAGTGGLVTFKDSRWLMSVVLYHQPHFRDQPAGVQVFWGYALHPDRVGDFVGKAMSDCSGHSLAPSVSFPPAPEGRRPNSLPRVPADIGVLRYGCIGDQDADAAFPEVFHHRRDVDDRPGVDAGERFVEQQDGGVGGHGARDLATTAFPAGERDGRGVADVFDVEFVQQVVELAAALPRGVLEHFEHGRDVLPNGHAAKNRCLLREIAEAEARARTGVVMAVTSVVPSKIWP